MSAVDSNPELSEPGSNRHSSLAVGLSQRSSNEGAHAGAAWAIKLL